MQFTNNFTWFRGKHSMTFGANFEKFSLLQLVQHLPERRVLPTRQLDFPAATTFRSLQEFFDATDPNNPNQIDFNCV